MVYVCRIAVYVWDFGENIYKSCVGVPMHILYLGFRGGCHRGCKGLSGVPQVWSGAHHFGSFVTHNVYVILVTININAKVKNCSEGYFFFPKTEWYFLLMQWYLL